MIYEAHVRGMTQFKSMVRELQAANIEVILDVVYNHTGEGNHLGPTLSMRGVDNPAYYRLVESDLRYYMDYTGTGSSCPATATGRNGPLYWTPLPGSRGQATPGDAKITVTGRSLVILECAT